MKISDQTLTGRFVTKIAPTDSGDHATSAELPALAGHRIAGDTLQLSSLVARLRQRLTADADRAARVTQIAKRVTENTYSVASEEISTAIVSEALEIA